MIPQDYFKFRISFDRHSGMTDGMHKIVSIVTQAPYLYMRYDLGTALENEERLRTVKAELKMAMIEAILKGEWELEKI